MFKMLISLYISMASSISGVFSSSFFITTASAVKSYLLIRLIHWYYYIYPFWPRLLNEFVFIIPPICFSIFCNLVYLNICGFSITFYILCIETYLPAWIGHIFLPNICVFSLLSFFIGF